MAIPIPQPGPSNLPTGHKGPRRAILVELKHAQPLSAKELAGKLGVSLNGVRHHLKELEADGLIQYQRQHRGVGAPVFAYRLSAEAEALFPRRYEATLFELLDHMVEREGRAAAVRMLEAHYADLAHRLKTELADAPPARRLEAVARTLADEGYMTEWQAAAPTEHASGTLTEHNCAIQSVAERFPELCAAEARFLEDVLGAPVDRRAHILEGCTACEYHVRFAGPEGPAAAGTEETA
ncbi:MAG TPA: helix-turn-helix domain-containing protein [Gemmatimonadales bacterium]|nr:helix-turn-helix domain-containing protein [Gemmatimonadales bacterium]